MPRLRQLTRRKSEAGEPLPPVFSSFEKLNVGLRRGQAVLVGAAPGVGKSVLALTYVLEMKVPTLYLAMDSDAPSMAARVYSRVKNVSHRYAEELVDSGDPQVSLALDDINWVDFQFPESPDIKEVVDRTRAFAEVQGEYPHLIVIDNLMDLSVGEDEATTYKEGIVAAVRLARASKAAVLVLCHVMGEYEDGDKIIPQGGFLYKIAKKPSLALTMNHGTDPQSLWVSVVKNRSGPSSANGKEYRVRLRRDYSRMKIEDER